MKRIIVSGRDGDERCLEAKPGYSVMEVIRDGGFDELLALCGGCCSCGTCHVHVEEAYLDLLTPMSEDEDDLLYTSEHRTTASRLSCQLAADAVPDGLRVRIAPED